MYVFITTYRSDAENTGKLAQFQMFLFSQQRKTIAGKVNPGPPQAELAERVNNTQFLSNNSNGRQSYTRLLSQ
jgi:hypothetical protein